MNTIWILLSLLCVVWGKRACYPNLGCFSDHYPYEDFPMPTSPNRMEVSFRLYTRENRGNDDYKVITPNRPSRYFDSSKPTKMYIHGWCSEGGNEFAFQMKDALLNHGDYNVILVDWSDAALTLDYLQASSDTRVVGAQLAHLVRTYESSLWLHAEDVHCIGHSLGAHLCGYMGKRLNYLGIQMGRITGLDPAGPLFFTTDSAGRLYKGDAKFVDIIHTNGGKTFIIAGIGKQSGDVDFYPNGGAIQTGCEDPPSDEYRMLLQNVTKQSITEALCSHGLSKQFFLSSLQDNDCKFLATRCKSEDDVWMGKCDGCKEKTTCQYMGINANKHPDRIGSFYLPARARAPYCDT